MARIAMARMFDNIVDHEDTTTNLTVEEIEKALVENYMSRKKLNERGYSDEISEYEYDMEGEALWEEEVKLREAYKNIYPYAFNKGTMMDEAIYDALNIPFEQGDIITPEDILNATKLDDTDVKYICKVRTFHNGKFINNYVTIYMDNDYTTQRAENFEEDYNNTCSAIAYAIGHEFVAVVEIKKAYK